MVNRKPTKVLSVAGGSSSYSADINASIILMPNGLKFYDIPSRGGRADG
mgnify:CR=1 FL=1